MTTLSHRTHRIETGFPFTSLWHGFINFFTVINSALAAKHEYTQLAILKDEQLAQKGLARNEIAKHVAKKYF